MTMCAKKQKCAWNAEVKFDNLKTKRRKTTLFFAFHHNIFYGIRYIKKITEKRIEQRFFFNFTIFLGVHQDIFNIMCLQ